MAKNTSIDVNKSNNRITPNINYTRITVGTDNKLYYISDDGVLHHLAEPYNLPVINYTTSNPSSLSPNQWDRYIVPVSATNDWLNKDNSIAQWNGTEWEYFVPEAGWVAYIKDISELWVFKGNVWEFVGGEQVSVNADELTIEKIRDFPPYGQNSSSQHLLEDTWGLSHNPSLRVDYTVHGGVFFKRTGKGGETGGMWDSLWVYGSFNQCDFDPGDYYLMTSEDPTPYGLQLQQADTNGNVTNTFDPVSIEYDNGMYFTKWHFDSITTIYQLGIQFEHPSFYVAFVEKDTYPMSDSNTFSVYGGSAIIGRGGYSLDQFGKKADVGDRELVTRAFVENTTNNADDVTTELLTQHDIEVSTESNIQLVLNDAWDLITVSEDWTIGSNVSCNNGVIILDNETDYQTPSSGSIMYRNDTVGNAPFTTVIHVISNYNFNNIWDGNAGHTQGEFRVEDHTEDEILDLGNGEFLYTFRVPAGTRFIPRSISCDWNLQGSGLVITDFLTNPALGGKPYFKFVRSSKYPPKNVIKVKEIDYIIDDDNQSIDGSDTPMDNPHHELVTRSFIESNTSGIPDDITVNSHPGFGIMSSESTIMDALEQNWVYGEIRGDYTAFISTNFKDGRGYILNNTSIGYISAVSGLPNWDAGTYELYSNIDLSLNGLYLQEENTGNQYYFTTTYEYGLYRNTVIIPTGVYQKLYLDTNLTMPCTYWFINRFITAPSENITIKNIDLIIGAGDASIDGSNTFTTNSKKELVTKDFIEKRTGLADDVTLERIKNAAKIDPNNDYQSIINTAWDKTAQTSGWTLDSQITFANGVFTFPALTNISITVLESTNANTLRGGYFKLLTNTDLSANGLLIRIQDTVKGSIVNPYEIIPVTNGNWQVSFFIPDGFYFTKLLAGGNNIPAGFNIQMILMDEYPPKDITKIKEINYIIDDDTESIDGSDTPMSNANKELVTRAYIDKAVNAVSSLLSVRFIETVFNIDLGNPPSKIDYKDVSDGDLICLSSQTDAIENGLYTVDSVNGWARSEPLLLGTPAEGILFTVSEGCLNSDTLWVFTNNTGSDITGTDELYLKQLSADGTVNKNEKVVVSAVDEANQFITLAESPVASKHLLVSLNGQTLSGGNGFDYEISDKRIVFYTTIELNDIIDVYYSYIPGGHCIPPVPPSPYFEFDVVIHNAGDSFPMNLIEVPSGGNIDIIWGDGNTQSSGVNLNNIAHTYTDIGTYRVKIQGHDWIKFSDGNTYDWDVTVKHWGNDTWKSLSGMFSSMNKISFNTDTPFSTSNSVSLQDLFRNSPNFNNDISDWDLSNVISIESMFNGCSSFNQNLSTMVIHNGIITSLNGIFMNCSSLTYRPNWDTSSITDMTDTFNGASSFNANIGAVWVTSAVTKMDRMFKNTSNFNQDISGWDVSNVTSCSEFRNGSALECSNTPLLAQACTGCFDKFKFDVTVSANDVFKPHIRSKGDTDLVVDWGDGNIENLGLSYNNTKLHTYTSGGTFSVEVYGHRHFKFYGSGNYPVKVTHWGNDNAWEDLSSMFRIPNLLIEPDDNLSPTNLVNANNMFRSMPSFNSDISAWGTQNFTNINSLFYGCTTFNQDISGWDTSNVADMSQAFRNCFVFNQPIGNWNTSKVTTLNNTFNQAYEFNQDLNSWDVSNVTNMSYTFSGAFAFNGDVSSWDTSKVTVMDNLFLNNKVFNQDISGWDTSSVTNMASILNGCLVFDQDLSSWNTSNVTTLNGSFYGCYAFNHSINSWDVSKVTDLNNTFYYCKVFNQPLNSWDTSSVTSMLGTFRRAHAFNQDLNSWDVSNVTNLQYAFYEASSFNGNISNWQINSCTSCYGTFRSAIAFNGDLLWGSSTSSLTTTNSMFNGASVFNGDISGWDTSSITDMGNMFGGAVDFAGDISGWDTSSCTRMNTMLQSCKNFVTDISSWDVSKVTSMNTMLQGCIHFNAPIGIWDTSSLVDASSLFAVCYDFNQPIGSWNTSNVTTMASMFNRATSFNRDISSWDTSSVTNFSRMFYNATTFNQPLDAWNTSSATNINNMFGGASSFNQDLSSWNTAFVTNMSYTFGNAAAFNGDISTWDTSSVTNMSAMFQSDTSFNGDLSGWDVSKVENFSAMFYNNNSFSADISGWNTSSATSFKNTFRNTDSFNIDISGWNTSLVTDMSYIFQDNDIFNQNISGWDISSVQYCTGFRGGTSVLTCPNTPALPNSCTGC